jgi:hypothetical protein|tara:strand:+ start:324 stop:623 length:300 start_codon:yes stop_codon:yes gene_type:complete
MASFHSKDSFLRRAPVKGLYLDINQLPSVPKSRGDQLYEIEHQYEGRPDLLADKLYGTVRLWWLFAMRNPDLIIDPIEDFKAGVTIYLPSGETIQRIIG